MFANVRLMLVAISASLLAVVCAMALFMGVFAVFSVAHEPFSTLAAARPPLQIAFADDITAAVADGKPAPFGVRFQVNAPPIAKRPVIVAVPQAVAHAATGAPVVAEPVTNAAANAQPAAAPPPDGVQQSAQSGAATETEKTGDKANEKTDAAKLNSIASNAAAVANGGAATIKIESESPTSDRVLPAAIVPRRAAPPIRIASHESDNPASVTMSPAPTPAGNKATKRRKLAARLRQSHHFRRPRLHQTAAEQAQTGYSTGIVQPNAYPPPSYATGTYGQSSGFTQQGFGFTPAAIKPKATRLRRATTDNSANR